MPQTGVHKSGMPVRQGETGKNMTYNNSPIGVFDSGMGGVSVLKELVKLMPNEDFIYVGDSENAPYGTKGPETVRKLTVDNIKYLISKGVKAAVIACNTATSVGAAAARGIFDIPIIGIEPALKPAVSMKKEPFVAVMATPLTLKEEKFAHLMGQYIDKAQIYKIPCPKLVEFVENGILGGEELESSVREYFRPIKNKHIDAVVLGCTHYSFVKETIKKVVGNGVSIFDGGEGTAKELLRRLKEENMTADPQKKGNVYFENTSKDEKMLELEINLFVSK